MGNATSFQTARYPLSGEKAFIDALDEIVRRVPEVWRFERTSDCGGYIWHNPAWSISDVANACGQEFFQMHPEYRPKRI